MKKIIFICAIILFSTISTKLSTTAQEKDAQWLKLNNYIYIDESSITKEKYLTSAWLKEYNTMYDKINGVPVYYNLVKYEVDCINNAIEIKHFKYFDKNHNLLKDEPYNYGVGCSCNGLVDGEIICKSICKN